MIYVDTSVVLAELLHEKTRPAPGFWTNPLTSSRLLEYEVIVRLNALRKPTKVITLAKKFLVPIRWAEFDPSTLNRALQPFPVSVRTLDAIHLSTMLFLQGRGITVELASYDARLNKAAMAMGIVIVPL